MDSSGGLEGVETGPSEAWASRPADLPRHWLGETEDAPEELLQSEPADPAGHWLGETEDALREPRSRERRPVGLQLRLGPQGPGQVSQLIWRGIGSEGLRMPPRSCRAPSRAGRGGLSTSTAGRVRRGSEGVGVPAR